MDLLSLFYSLLLTLILFVNGIWSLTLQASVNPLKPVLGDIGFTLNCRITFADGESPQGVTLARKRETDPDFSVIVSFPPPNILINFTYYDEELKSRTVVTDSNNLNPTLTFSDTKCSDIAQYRWKVNYYMTGSAFNEILLDVKVKVESSFTGSSDFGIKTSTDYEVREGTNVTFTCKANVGNEPKGDLVWYYYLTNPGVPFPIYNLAVNTDPVPYNICSYSQESTLVMMMTSELNGVMVRCTIQQDVTDIADNHRQTNPFSVTFSPKLTTIAANPYHAVYSEGEPELTFACSSIANPVASFFWRLPDGSESPGHVYYLQNLQVDNTGNYTCIAKNEISNKKYTDSHTFELIVVERTTTSTGTVRSYPTAAPKDDTTESGATGNNEPEAAKEITASFSVGAAVGAGFGAVAIVMIVLFGVWKRRILKERVFKNKSKSARENHVGNVHNYANMDAGTKVSADMINTSAKVQHQTMEYRNDSTQYEGLEPRRASLTAYERIEQSKSNQGESNEYEELKDRSDEQQYEQIKLYKMGLRYFKAKQEDHDGSDHSPEDPELYLPKKTDTCYATG